jgi:hypothetical protein
LQTPKNRGETAVAIRKLGLNLVEPVILTPLIPYPLKKRIPVLEVKGMETTTTTPLPLVAYTPFQRSDLYGDDFENKSAQSEDYDARS